MIGSCVPRRWMLSLVARGNRATSSRPEQPGALKIYSYKNGVLANLQSIAPGGGFNYQPRHLDFHPSGRWDFVTLEPQNKLLVYQRKSDGTLGPDALFAKDTLADPGNVRPGQIAGTVHVHPNGRIVYVANRASGATDFEGRAVFVGGENTIAVFAINQDTGEPTLIQNIDTQGIHARTFALDASGKILVAGNTRQLFVRDGAGVRALPASLAVFRVRLDGKLDFVRKYDVEVGRSELFWMAMTSLP
jgi:6-phosphogluconolactonase